MRNGKVDAEGRQERPGGQPATRSGRRSQSEAKTVLPPKPPVACRLLPRIPPYTVLDACRGAAALWVVMFHACVPYISNGHAGFLRNPVFAAGASGQLGVVLFFVISGYCISGAAYSCIANGKPLSHYALNRARRIYPPYLAACAAALAAAALTRFLQRLHVVPMSNSAHLLPFRDLSFWITNLTLTHAPLGQPSLLLVAWSLCYEIAFYLIVGAFLAIGNLAGPSNLRRRAQFLFYACVATTLASLAWLCLSPMACPFPLNLWYQFGFGAVLFAVTACRRWRSGELFVNISAFACVILGVTYACCNASTEGHLARPSARTQAFAGVFFFLVLLWLKPFSDRLTSSRWVTPLVWLGTISYSLYLIHPVVIPFADAGLRRIGFDGDRYLLTFSVELVTAVGAGWLFFVLVERHFTSPGTVVRIESESAQKRALR